MEGHLLAPLLALVEEAGATFDQYPYGAGSTLLASLLPPLDNLPSKSCKARSRLPRSTCNSDVPAGQSRA